MVSSTYFNLIGSESESNFLISVNKSALLNFYLEFFLFD